jgi:putative ABC transport system permease protein
MLREAHEDDVPLKDRIAWSRSPGMRLTDADYLDTASADVDEVRRSIDRRGQIQLGGYRVGWARVRGVTEVTYSVDTPTVALDEGRLLNDEDYREGRKVCLLSWGLRDEFAGRLKDRSGSEPSLIGRSATYRGIRFEVVGTLRPRDPDYQPWHLNRVMIVPLKAMQTYIAGSNPDPGWMSVVVTDAERFDEQAGRISRIITGLHRGITDFEYHGAEWADNMRRMMTNIQMIMGILAGVSLLVGGLGIMNVMLSSISERIKEIGIRKALGARKAQIFIQFLAETTTLSCTGGSVGAALGLVPMLFGEAIKESTQGVMMPTILPEHALIVILTIVLVGVVFGLYPAIKASRMDPVDALRYE